MNLPPNSPVVRTTTGDIEPQDVGITASHEHVIVNVERPLTRQAPASQRALQRREITLGDYYDIRRNNTNAVDRRLDDTSFAVEEVGHFRAAGGRTIVEVTSMGLGRDPLALRAISELSGVQIVMGSGLYVQEFLSEEWKRMDSDAIAEMIIGDVTTGVDGTGVRAGIIGEIGMTSPWNSGDEISLRGAARAQLRTGAPMMIHPGRDASDLSSYASVLEDEGVDPSRVVIAHIERTLFTLSEMTDLLDRGYYVAFDLFGHEMSYYPLSDIDMPNDAQRVKMIRALADRGHIHKVLMSQDVYRKTALRRWGGEGYGHILERVVPLMRRRDFSAEEIEILLINNAQKFLQFVPRRA